MAIAIDSSVLLAVFKDEPNGEAWVRRLAVLKERDPLVACEVVWAEVAPAFSDVRSLEMAMLNLGVAFASLSLRASFQAGQLFAAYRRDGGTRRRILPDFMIAAHAMVEARGLVTADAGYLRSYFKPLLVLGLDGSSRTQI